MRKDAYCYKVKDFKIRKQDAAFPVIKTATNEIFMAALRAS